MAVSDSVLERAWELWSRAWDPKDRDIGVYKLALKDITDEQLREAARLALTECRFFPSPYEIVRLAPVRHGNPVERQTLAGFRPVGALTPSSLKAHRLRCEAWFAAIRKADQGLGLADPEGGERITGNVNGDGFLAVAKKLIATQYVLCNRELNLRESFKENTTSPEQGAADLMGLEVGGDGVLQHVLETETGSMGVRPDSSPPAVPTPLDPVHEPKQHGGATEEDATDTGAIPLGVEESRPDGMGLGSTASQEPTNRADDSGPPHEVDGDREK